MDQTANTIRHVLCVVDGSAEACRAAELGACLARDLGAKLSFVAIAKPIKPTPELQTYLQTEGLQGIEIPMPIPDAEACLRTASDIARSCGTPDMSAKVEVGQPLKVISEKVQRDGVDLVMLGHRNWFSAAHPTRRPIAGKILEELGANVLAVP